MRQKIVLGVFLCLSLVMLIVSVVRVCKVKDASHIDGAWVVFWQQMEGVVAILMASITTFRTIFVGQGSRILDECQPRPSHSWLAGIKLKKSSTKINGVEEGKALPAIPAATLTGLRTLIRRNHRSPGATTLLQSDIASLDEEAYLWQPSPMRNKPDHQAVYLKRDWRI
jgi:hypothetical protein